jgi:hypothetical protein
LQTVPEYFKRFTHASKLILPIKAQRKILQTESNSSLPLRAKKKAKGKRQKAKGKRQKAKGKRQKAKGKRQKAKRKQHEVYKRNKPS